MWPERELRLSVLTGTLLTNATPRTNVRRKAKLVTSASRGPALADQCGDVVPPSISRLSDSWSVPLRAVTDMDTAPQYSPSGSTNDDSDSTPGSPKSLSNVGQETPRQPDGEVLDRATGDALPSDKRSALLQPRSYQLEMLEISLERNIIVVVSMRLCLYLCPALSGDRWTLAAERLTCTTPLSSDGGLCSGKKVEQNYIVNCEVSVMLTQCMTQSYSSHSRAA